jgi:ATP-binding cassette subfamily B protein
MLMRSTPLLLCLDEPGHSLDAQAEQNVHDADLATAQHIAREAGGITIFVRHRLSTARLAHVVVVLEGGGAAEFGTHDALLAGGGHYAELRGMQAKTYTP